MTVAIRGSWVGRALVSLASVIPTGSSQQPLEPMGAELCPYFAAEAGTANGFRPTPAVPP